MIEESERKFDAQNAAYRFVEHALGNLTGLHLGRDDGCVETALHVHIYAGLKGAACNSGSIADGVVFQLRDGSPVGNDKTLETPLLAQNLRHDERVCGCG